MKFSSVLILLFWTAFHLLRSQSPDQKVWSRIQETDVQFKGQRQIIPQKYLVYRLNTTSIKDQLFKAPQETETRINESNCIVLLPVPDGTMQRFRVVQSAMMAPELAVSYPDIKTFSVKGIDDPYASGKLDWNEFGFHGMVLSPNGDFFIDPYCTGNITDYVVYYTNDFIKDPSHVIPEAGLVVEPAEEKPVPQKKKESGGSSGSKSPPGVCVGANLRTFRLAVACTGEYAIAATGFTAPTVAQTLARVVTSINRVDGVYEKEVSVRLVLVASTTLVLYTDPATDPFTGSANTNAQTLIGLSQSVITASIGVSNYDIGHTFSTGAGGLANLGCACVAGQKARGVTGNPMPVGDPYDIDYVSHEIGHQLGGNHTFNAVTDNCGGSNRNGSTSVEPGSGVTIMAYAGICGTNNVLSNSIPYFHAISYDEIVNYTNSGTGSGCAVVSATGNQPPAVTAAGTYTIPRSTPFYLSGNATDPDGDLLTYSWEETDAGSAGGNWNSGLKPFFRSYAPVTGTTRFFPRSSVVLSGNHTGTIGEYLPNTAQVLNFRLTARDNKMGGGGVCYASTQVTIDTCGPLTVSYPSATDIFWVINSNRTITWDVNFTNLPPVKCDSVRILISYDGGSNYSILVASAPNNGAYLITAPNLTTTINTCRIKIESIGNIFYDISNNNFTISTDPFAVVKDHSLNNQVSFVAWPNPANSEISFIATGLNPKKVTKAVIMDMLGRLVMEKTYEDKSMVHETLTLSALPEGIYLMKISNDHRQSVQRIIKK